jgi:phosphatidylserine/phosphatidylglycerophosphate/cardiolipin synthase-like enzyme
MERELKTKHFQLQWVNAEVLADDPRKVVRGQNDSEGMVIENVMDLLNSAQSDVLSISPYFVPGDVGLATSAMHQQRGVRVRILTNSLASTDAPAVHIGYASYRVALLHDGVDLYELRPYLDGTKHSVRTGFAAFGSSHASLHAKAIVIDRKTLFIGSMNLDPRSAFENTEIGLVLHSPELASEVASEFDELVNSDAYHVRLTEQSTLEWVLGQPPNERVFTVEPEAGFLRRLEMLLLAPLAPEDLL